MTYRPSRAPEIVKLEELVRWVEQEFEKISSDSLILDQIQLTELTAAPAKPRKGMVVYADGTLWNPGAGAGFYGYNGAAWAKF